MGFALFLLVLLLVSARVSVAADEWSIRSQHGDAVRAGIDFLILTSLFFVIWLGVVVLL